MGNPKILECPVCGEEYEKFTEPRRWEVASVSYDLPAILRGRDKRRAPHSHAYTFDRSKLVAPESPIRVEEVDDSILFAKAHCEWAVADTYEAFWNRLNDSDRTLPFNCHRADQFVRVLWARRLPN